MKGKIISFLIVAIVTVGLFVLSFSEKNYGKANGVYKVYLNGEKIGLLNDKDDLYDLINEKQQEIKDKYGVTNVYPPNGFSIVKSYAYDEQVNDVDEIYHQIESVDNFTIKGYTITIHQADTEAAKNTNDDVTEEEVIEETPTDRILVINVLDKKVFENALLNYIHS